MKLFEQILDSPRHSSSTALPHAQTGSQLRPAARSAAQRGRRGDRAHQQPACGSCAVAVANCVLPAAVRATDDGRRRSVRRSGPSPLEKADLAITRTADQLGLADRLRASATGGTTASPVTSDGLEFLLATGATIVFDRWCGRARPAHRLPLGARQDFPEARAGSTPARPARAPPAVLPASLLDDAIMGRTTTLDFAPRCCRPIRDAGDLRGFSSGAATASRCPRSPARPRRSCRQVDIIQRAFGLTPFNWYGSRECGRIATECHVHRGLHVNAWGLLVEVRKAAIRDARSGACHRHRPVERGLSAIAIGPVTSAASYGTVRLRFRLPASRSSSADHRRVHQLRG